MNLLTENLEDLQEPRFILKVIDGVLGVEKVTPAEAQARFQVCFSCPHYNEAKRKCRICKCYLDVKTEQKFHREPTRLGAIERTHCWLAKWPGDNLKEVNAYRKLKGLTEIIN